MRTRISLKRRFSYRQLSLVLTVLFLCLSLSGCNVTLERPESPDLPVGDGDLGGGGSGDRPRVALTFDDGPNHYNNRTKNYVDELNKYGYKATFFVVGNRVMGGDAVKYAVDNGMEIGIHGYTHNVYYDGCTEEAFFREMNLTAEAIHKQVPDYEIKLMRPVGGHISNEIAAVCPYAIIKWSVDSDDWNNTYAPGDGAVGEDGKTGWDRKAEKIADNVLKNVKDGDIILMHDIYESTFDATVILLARLHDMGYEVVTVSELLGTTQPGRIYYNE